MGKVYHYNGMVQIKDLFALLKSKITTPFEGETNNWMVVSEKPESIIFKMKTNPVNTVQKEAYIKLSKYEYSGTPSNNHIVVEYSDEYDDVTEELTTVSPTSYLTPWIYSGVGGIFKRQDYHYLNYMITVDNDSLQIVLQGDPTLDFDAYAVSYLYFGSLNAFNDTDNDGNIALTCGTFHPGEFTLGGIMPSEYEFTSDATKGYGIYTSKGMKDISMLRTFSGIMYQSHIPTYLNEGSGVHSQSQAGGLKNNFFFNASEWTSKFHASPIYVSHSYDGYRGSMRNVVAINGLDLLDSDVLQENVGTEEVPVYEEYKPIKIHTNSGVNFIKYSANPEYILAMRIK